MTKPVISEIGAYSIPNATSPTWKLCFSTPIAFDNKGLEMNIDKILITKEQVEDYINVMANGDMSFVLSVLADLASGIYTPEQLKDDILGINQE